jgi:tubulin polyglutamylase TTLL6/13
MTDPDEEQKVAKKNRGSEPEVKAGAKKKKKKRRIVANLDHCAYPIIYKCVKRKGWKIAERNERWDFGWSDCNQLVRELGRQLQNPQHLSPVQRLNHAPNMKQLYRKDNLAENMNLLRQQDPETFNFVPLAWNVPADVPAMKAFLRAEKKRQEEQGTEPITYIYKPAAGLQGKGIHLTYDPTASVEEAIVNEQKVVIQQYLHNPLLIDGFKFDLRLYVLVLSIDPMKISIFNDGLVRFATKKYVRPDKKNVKSRMMHLTNYSLNKNSKNFVKGANGSKRCIKAMFKNLAEMGHNTELIWSNIVDVIVKTMLGLQPQLAHSYRKFIPRSSTLGTQASTCFEILGFDVMLDEHCKAYLIEVNHAPSFKGGSKVDDRIKTAVISQALDLIDVTEKRKKMLEARVKKQWAKHMWQQVQEKSKKIQAATLARRTTGCMGKKSNSAVNSAVNNAVNSAVNSAVKKESKVASDSGSSGSSSNSSGNSSAGSSRRTSNASSDSASSGTATDRRVSRVRPRSGVRVPAARAPGARSIPGVRAPGAAALSATTPAIASVLSGVGGSSGVAAVSGSGTTSGATASADSAGYSYEAVDYSAMGGGGGSSGSTRRASRTNAQQPQGGITKVYEQLLSKSKSCSTGSTANAGSNQGSGAGASGGGYLSEDDDDDEGDGFQNGSEGEDEEDDEAEAEDCSGIRPPHFGEAGDADKCWAGSAAGAMRKASSRKTSSGPMSPAEARAMAILDDSDGEGVGGEEDDEIEEEEDDDEEEGGEEDEDAEEEEEGPVQVAPAPGPATSGVVAGAVVAAEAKEEEGGGGDDSSTTVPAPAPAPAAPTATEASTSGVSANGESFEPKWTATKAYAAPSFADPDTYVRVFSHLSRSDKVCVHVFLRLNCVTCCNTLLHPHTRFVLRVMHGLYRPLLPRVLFWIRILCCAHSFLRSCTLKCCKLARKCSTSNRHDGERQRTARAREKVNGAKRLNS